MYYFDASKINVLGLSRLTFQLLQINFFIYITSHQYLTNVQSCKRRNHGQTIHPTEFFISMNLLQMPCVIT